MAKGGNQQKLLQQKKERAKEARRRARRKRMFLTWGATAAVFTLIIIVAIMVLTGGDEGDLASGGDSPTPTPTPTASLPDGCTAASPSKDHPSYDEPPPMKIDPAKSYTATIQTNCGDMTVDLFAEKAPKTVNSFVFLAREGFYDGVLFHRVINDFMIQGGDPEGTGSGGPGYTFEDENIEREFDKPGLLAMANSGPGSNGSQFFITEAVIQHLNAPGQCPGPQGCHSVFGELVEGEDVLQRIVGIQTSGSPTDRPLADVVIKTITITEK